MLVFWPEIIVLMRKYHFFARFLHALLCIYGNRHIQTAEWEQFCCDLAVNINYSNYGSGNTAVNVHVVCYLLTVKTGINAFFFM